MRGSHHQPSLEKANKTAPPPPPKPIARPPKPTKKRRKVGSTSQLTKSWQVLMTMTQIKPLILQNSHHHFHSRKESKLFLFLQKRLLWVQLSSPPNADLRLVLLCLHMLMTHTTRIIVQVHRIIYPLRLMRHRLPQLFSQLLNQPLSLNQLPNLRSSFSNLNGRPCKHACSNRSCVLWCIH